MEGGETTEVWPEGGAREKAMLLPTSILCTVAIFGRLAPSPHWSPGERSMSSAALGFMYSSLVDVHLLKNGTTRRSNGGYRDITRAGTDCNTKHFTYVKI